MKYVFFSIFLILSSVIFYWLGLSHAKSDNERLRDMFMSGYDYGRSSESAIMSNWYLRFLNDQEDVLPKLQMLRLSLTGINNLYDGDKFTELSLVAEEMGFDKGSTRELYERNIHQLMYFIESLESKLE